MIEPRKWSLQELASDSEEAKALVRKQRLEEPHQIYEKYFQKFRLVFRDIVERLPTLSEDPVAPDTLAELARDVDALTAFRYLAAIPVSEDDLKTLADSKLSATALRSDSAQALRVRDTIWSMIDSHRFPWVADRRVPTRQEREHAINASASLVAVRKVETARRSQAKDWQEQAVKKVLRDSGYQEVAGREITLLDAAPASGKYCGECKLGETRADLVVRLPDSRVLPVECKVSNSAVNSFKRVNHEAAGKARAWIDKYGRWQIVPCVVIHGVFNPSNLETAQAEGLTIIWSHRLEDFADLVGRVCN